MNKLFKLQREVITPLLSADLSIHKLLQEVNFNWLGTDFNYGANLWRWQNDIRFIKTLIEDTELRLSELQNEYHRQFPPPFPIPRSQ